MANKVVSSRIQCVQGGKPVFPAWAQAKSIRRFASDCENAHDGKQLNLPACDIGSAGWGENVKGMKKAMDTYRRRLSTICFTLLGACFLVGSSSQSWSAGMPNLPSTSFDYVDYAVSGLPAHFATNQPRPGGNSVISRDNTPADNPITNAGATLGRVLFYDKRLSHGNGVACASCHTQETGFSDPNRFSIGVNGETPRHSMALTNTKFYDNGRMFWDERADSVEHQALLPIQDPIEMDLRLNDMVTKLSNTTFYGDLFDGAFGTPEVTSERVSQAIAQFVRSLVSYESKFDSAFNAAGQPDFPGTFTASERRGHQIFTGQGRCADCHQSNAQVANQPTNNGLDQVITDDGAGGGRFKVPSLRNVEVREGFMHDGRFETLEQVVQFYSTGIQDSPTLDPRLRGPDGQPIRPNFSPGQMNDLVAFLATLTDDQFLTAEMFSNPFGNPCDFDSDGTCGIDDFNWMLSQGPLNSSVAVDASGNELFDLNGDGTIDGTDVDVWLEQAALANGFASAFIKGDANLDGFVDASDFNAWNSGKFTLTTDWSQGDFNHDGVVDTSDFNIWNENKFASSDRSDWSAVPEPSGILLSLLGLFGSTHLARRKR